MQRHSPEYPTRRATLKYKSGRGGQPQLRPCTTSSFPRSPSAPLSFPFAGVSQEGSPRHWSGARSPLPASTTHSRPTLAQPSSSGASLGLESKLRHRRRGLNHGRDAVGLRCWRGLRARARSNRRRGSRVREELAGLDGRERRHGDRGDALDLGRRRRDTTSRRDNG